ncbi:hypothetical protein PT974_05460 [Cladobotryum mycophilum]|uniref:Cobalamin-independent methionine synthase MetE C-terminal/archaeal domain-containing protein n=1 Tax=Cladobotryum mycophilum TaxID=491253 RepID=A0ABR0SIS6_9HYPO
MARVSGCHLVGSVPLEDTETVFCRCIGKLSGRLGSIPDGETGSRTMFTQFQRAFFPQVMLRESRGPDFETYTEDEIAAGIRLLEENSHLPTGYEDAAITSYNKFKKLQNEGTIPNGIKFQVCLPTIANVVGVMVKSPFQARVEPIYERALFRSLRAIQDSIPHEDLAIQIDMGMDLSFWEDLFLKPWFQDRNYVVEYIVRMIGQVAYDVELGLHFCYGDINHQHYTEPESLASVVDIGQRVMSRSPHKISWAHFPVPVSAMDRLDTYYAPLATIKSELEKHKTKLYLGVVQYNDLPGTEKRIEAASRVVSDFGVAAECGFGRTPVEEIDNILEIMKSVSTPLERNKL